MKSQLFFNMDTGAPSGGGTATISEAPVSAPTTPVPEASGNRYDISTDKAPTTPTEGHWSHTFEGLDDSAKGHKSLLSFKNPVEAIKAYVNVQPLIGADKVPLPKDWNDPEQLNSFASKIGRPESSKEYALDKFEFPEGITEDTQMVDKFKDMAHKYALSPWQCKGIVKEYMAVQTEKILQEHAQVIQDREDRMAQYEQSVGSSKFDEQVQIARNAMRVYGGSELDALLKETGLNKEPTLVKIFAKIGSDIREGRANVSSGQNAVFNADTPEGATQRIAELGKDPDFLKAFQSKNHPGHKEALELWHALHEKQIAKV